VFCHSFLKFDLMSNCLYYMDLNPSVFLVGTATVMKVCVLES
jgi:hypothetical protein